MEAPVLTGRSQQGGKNRGPAEGSPGMERMRWGFPVPEKKSGSSTPGRESALEKRIFRDNLLHRRCAYRPVTIRVEPGTGAGDLFPSRSG